MTDILTPHRARPDEWAHIEKFKDFPLHSVLLEYRYRLAVAEKRLAALEGNSSAGLTGSAPTGSLVAVVEIALMESIKYKRSMSRAAILAVANWLEQQGAGSGGSPRWLREEVERNG